MIVRARVRSGGVRGGHSRCARGAPMPAGTGKIPRTEALGEGFQWKAAPLQFVLPLILPTALFFCPSIRLYTLTLRRAGIPIVVQTQTRGHRPQGRLRLSEGRPQHGAAAGARGGRARLLGKGWGRGGGHPRCRASPAERGERRRGRRPQRHIWCVDLGVKSRRIRNGNCPSLWVKRDLSQQLEHVWALAKII